MAERSDYLYAQVRKKMLDAVRMDLIGPTAAEEALTELPTNSYITGMLYPADSDITEDENYNDVEFTEGRLDADGNGSESVVLEDEEPDESTKGGFKKPSSIGVSFYLSEETNKINVDVYWGSYYSDKVDGGEVVDESIEEDYENKKKRQVYVREQMAETVELNLDDIGRAKTISLHSNAHIFIYVIQMVWIMDIRCYQYICITITRTEMRRNMSVSCSKLNYMFQRKIKRQYSYLNIFAVSKN